VPRAPLKIAPGWRKRGSLRCPIKAVNDRLPSPVLLAAEALRVRQRNWKEGTTSKQIPEITAPRQRNQSCH
jgi:hypothetical protein